MMLHGGGVCYRGAMPAAEEMAKVYHVILERVSSGTIRKFEWIFRQFKE